MKHLLTYEEAKKKYKYYTNWILSIAIGLVGMVVSMVHVRNLKYLTNKILELKIVAAIAVSVCILYIILVNIVEGFKIKMEEHLNKDEEEHW